MATFQQPRRPLGTRHMQLQGPSNSHPSPSKQPRIVSGSKRPHSPDHGDAQPTLSAKRARATAQEHSVTAPPRDMQKELKHAEREQKAVEFKQKYTRAFPSWTFYFDSENIGHNVAKAFKSKILHLGGTIDDFFSSSVTHLITNLPVPTNTNPDKENSQKLKPSSKNTHVLKSPIKLVGRGGEDAAAWNVVSRAIEYNMKIWNTTKLDSVLARCLDPPLTKSPVINRFPDTSSAPQRSLSRLLQTEKIHGTTERDPATKRPDYHYFSRGACFVLLEDIHQQLATIAAHEYHICKDRDKSSKKPWPVLHCHPLSRNPFTPFDDKEKKRWERLQEAEKEAEVERHRKKRELEVVKRKEEAHNHVKPRTDLNLRRAVSMSNMKRRLSHPVGGKHDGHCIDLDADGDDFESAKASGYLASGAGMGYIAASGNSVGITSTTGTTSTSGQVLRNVSLPPAMQQQIKQQVVTSRKSAVKEKVESLNKAGLMGPPSKIPIQQPLLKKSKSTNTLKLPKREEGVKPGYCESCRAKFSDFTTHTDSKKHRKFASNPVNFQALDEVLDRVRRRPRQDVEMEEVQKTSHLFRLCKQNRHDRLDIPTS